MASKSITASKNQSYVTFTIKSVSVSRSGNTVTATINWSRSSSGNYNLWGGIVFNGTKTSLAIDEATSGSYPLKFTDSTAASHTKSFTFYCGGQQVIEGSHYTAEDTYSFTVPAKTFTLTFNSNGGTPTPASKTLAYQAAYGTLPTNVTKTGYTLNGWWTAASGGTQVTSSTKMGAANTTIYAHWTANSHTVTFNANGGTTPTASKSVSYGSTYGTLPTPTWAGHNFDGWYTAKTGGTQKTSSTTVNTDSDHTLYAHWSDGDVLVEFDANGGTSDITQKSVTLNGTYGELPTPSRRGYGFLGWYTDDTGGSLVESGTTVNTATTHTLYAHWKVLATAHLIIGGVRYDADRVRIVEGGVVKQVIGIYVVIGGVVYQCT